MIQTINNLSASVPDVAVLAFAGAAFGGLGALVSFAANLFWFHRWRERSAQEDKLADTAHTSLLGFSAFVLALAITNVFSNLGKTEEAVRLEALEIQRLDREFSALGATGAEGRRALAAYVRDVVADEWPRLARRPNTLSPHAQADLDSLWRSVRAAQKELGQEQPQTRDALSKYLMQTEQLRQGRLAAATNSIPDVFWIAILLFVLVASFMSGRNSHRAFGMQMNVLHMAAIGVVIALITILDDPFRGETSVPSSIIAEALQR